MSVFCILHCSNRTVIDCKYVCRQKIINFETRVPTIPFSGRSSRCRSTYLHVTDKQREENESESCDEYGERDFPNISARHQCLSEATAKGSSYMVSRAIEHEVSEENRIERIPQILQAPPEAVKILVEERGPGRLRIY